MKVTPDVTSNALRRAPRDATRINSNKNSINSAKSRIVNQDLQQSIGKRLNMEHSLADALTIAQVSSNIVQKAMVVSSRLRNIAAQALVSGRVDVTALQETVSQIPEDLNRFSDTFQKPPQVPAEMKAVSREVMEIPGAINNIRDIAENLNAGNIPEGETFNEIDRSLQGRDTALKEVANTFKRDILQVTGVDIREIQPEMPEQVSAAITGAPKTALAAQGNIIAETVAILT